MEHERQIKAWIKQDTQRYQALKISAELDLKDWCLAAGFVRNLIWDKLHGFECPTPLNDIDFIYFDAENIEDKLDREYQAVLMAASNHPWSVKNQARMHRRNNDAPYTSSCDAMSYWVEVETAIGARLDPSGEITLIAPLGFESLFDLSVSINRKRPKPEDFERRLSAKKWLEIWPKLQVER